MGRLKDISYYDAEVLLDAAVAKVKQGADRDKEIDKLCEHEVVTTYFTREQKRNNE